MGCPMANFYQNYYQGKKYNVKPGHEIHKMKRDNFYAQGSPKQKALRDDLLKFCKENNLLKWEMAKPRDFREAAQQIRAMYTLINKAELMDKWKSKGVPDES